MCHGSKKSLWISVAPKIPLWTLLILLRELRSSSLWGRFWMMHCSHWKIRPLKTGHWTYFTASCKGNDVYSIPGTAPSPHATSIPLQNVLLKVICSRICRCRWDFRSCFDDLWVNCISKCIFPINNEFISASISQPTIQVTDCAPLLIDKASLNTKNAPAQVFQISKGFKAETW